MAKMRHFIDSNKGATPLAVLALMAYFHRWDNPTLWVYLGLHGTYGILWVLKSAIFPDKTWESEASPPYGATIWLSLVLYWSAPFLIAWRDLHAPAWYLGCCVALNVFGVFLHFAADMQKHTALALRPGLITDGLFRHCRNPNYFGELLIYLGFGALAMHWFPPLVLAIFVVGFWIPRMRAKDRSLSRYPEFAAYKARTSLFIPFVI